MSTHPQNTNPEAGGSSGELFPDHPPVNPGGTGELFDDPAPGIKNLIPGGKPWRKLPRGTGKPPTKAQIKEDARMTAYLRGHARAAWAISVTRPGTDGRRSAQRDILLYLANRCLHPPHHEDYLTCYPGNKVIAEHLRLHLESVRRAFRALEARGLILRNRPRQEDTKRFLRTRITLCPGPLHAVLNLTPTLPAAQRAGLSPYELKQAAKTAKILHAIEGLPDELITWALDAEHVHLFRWMLFPRANLRPDHVLNEAKNLRRGLTGNVVIGRHRPLTRSQTKNSVQTRFESLNLHAKDAISVRNQAPHETLMALRDLEARTAANEDIHGRVVREIIVELGHRLGLL